MGLSLKKYRCDLFHTLDDKPSKARLKARLYSRSELNQGYAGWPRTNLLA